MVGLIILYNIIGFTKLFLCLIVKREREMINFSKRMLCGSEHILFHWGENPSSLCFNEKKGKTMQMGWGGLLYTAVLQKYAFLFGKIVLDITLFE